MILLSALAFGAEPLSLDLDHDGVSELFEATFDDEHHLQLTVSEGDQRHTLDLGEVSDINGPRTEVEVSVVPEAESGVPLLMLLVPRGEYCGSGNTWFYVSYVGDEPRRALQVADWSDAPVWTRVETTFDPKRRAVRIVRRYGEEDKTRSTDREKLTFVDGVYKE